MGRTFNEVHRLPVISSASNNESRYEPFRGTSFICLAIIQPIEIVFKSPTRPQSLLHLDNSLAPKPWETSSALLCAIRDATLATYLKEHPSLFLASFQALQIQESFFRKGLKIFDYHWVSTAKEKGIIQSTISKVLSTNMEDCMVLLRSSWPSEIPAHRERCQIMS
jgi:hypothetical protein